MALSELRSRDVAIRESMRLCAATDHVRPDNNTSAPDALDDLRSGVLGDLLFADQLGDLHNHTERNRDLTITPIIG